MPYADLEKRRQYHREYYRKYMQQWRAKNPERAKEQWTAWYAKNKEKKKAYAKQHRKNRNTPRNWIARVVARLKPSCSWCGYNNCSAALEFHHTNTKNRVCNITRQAVETHGWITVINELDKCIVLCANCHREVHAETGKERSLGED